METVSSVQLMGSGNQERLPVCLPDFPCLSSCVRLDADHPDAVCWHWHRALELFYLKQGSLEYQTAHQKIVLPEGACGLVNTGVLHRTQVPADSKPVIQLLHLFEPELITPADSRAAVCPLCSASDRQFRTGAALPAAGGSEVHPHHTANQRVL